MEKEKDNKLNNVLIYKEKPYYTDDELKLYYQIAIDESLKQGNEELATHYKILQDYLDNRDNHENILYDMIMNHNKNKK